MDRNLALYDVRSQVEQISKTLSQERLFARLTSFFGALAMLLACVGIYGVMGFAVTRRTRGSAEVRVKEAGDATGALATHDSPAAAVVVSLGAGGPGIGRRTARPPRTKSRGIRRKRDRTRGSAAQSAA